MDVNGDGEKLSTLDLTYISHFPPHKNLCFPLTENRKLSNFSWAQQHFPRFILFFDDNCVCCNKEFHI